MSPQKHRRPVHRRRRVKYIFVTGGVLSGLGKGITAASIGNLLKSRGFSVNIQKFDQYINVDAGTLNPAEHGEVFVTDDGAECDLDLGHYERFLNENLKSTASVMTGEIYQAVISRERRGDYLGKTVQVIPQVTDEVKKRARRAAYSNGYDFHIVEIGGTVGDNEGFHFLEAARQMSLDEGADNVLYVHVVFLPYLKASDEVKTKPAQNSVRELRSIGIQPDVLIARTDYPVRDNIVDKLSLYTNVAPEAIMPLVTVPSVYEVPLLMEAKQLDHVILNKLGLKARKKDNSRWRKFVQNIKKDKANVTIAMVGKYTTMLDTYASLVEALKAAAWHNNRDLTLRWVDAEELEKSDPANSLDNIAGIVVPGGFGIRGTEGKIKAIQYARENKIPYLGICLGMQLATIEFARNVLGVSQATSEEFIDEGDVSDKLRQACVIHIMDDQKFVKEKGGTMRLGGWDCWLREGTKTYTAYSSIFKKDSPYSNLLSQSAVASAKGGAKEDQSNKKIIRERHRHRYEFNNDFRQQLTNAGLRVAGTTPDNKLVEIIEVADHPWFVGVQFHPEFTSRPNLGHPLFNAFLAAAIKQST
ncbi:MAG: CTP synthase [bacterium]|nr:CTP synthase [bacterium]MDZ4343345.1 CTP synthase [Candidatus Binatia bacterium]